MTKYYASKVVNWALSQVGTKETGTNHNKYAADIDKNYPDFYNGKKQNVEWCDVFFDDGMLTNFGEKGALFLTCQPKHSAGAGCKYSYGYYKAKGQVGKTPKYGSQIFFGATEKTIHHTGYVVKVTSTTVTTVEGNKGNKVSKCTYKIGDKSIYGYGYPKYDPEPTTTEVKPTTSTPVKTETKIVSYKVNTKLDPLRMRKSAPTGSVVQLVPRGAVVKVDTSKSVTVNKVVWFYATYSNKSGYMSSVYLKKC